MDQGVSWVLAGFNFIHVTASSRFFFQDQNLQLHPDLTAESSISRMKKNQERR